MISFTNKFAGSSVLPCLLVTFLWASVSHSQTVVTLPFFEDFEASPGLFVPSGLNSSWDWGSPTTPFLEGPFSGQSSWATNLNGEFSFNEFSYLESPEFDFTGLTADPTLRFAHAFELGEFDEHWVELSIDGGTYQRLGASDADPGSLSWYNDVDNQWWDEVSGIYENWRTARHELTGAAGHLARFRWVLRSDSLLSSGEEGVALDDVVVYETLTDLSFSRLIGPLGGAQLAAAESIVVEVENTGSLPISAFTVECVVAGPLPTSFAEIVNQSIQPGEVAQVALSSTLDLSTVGAYELSFSVTVAGDFLVSNDMLTEAVVHQPVIDVLPWEPDFQDGNGLLLVGGPRASWEFGEPSQGANTGSFAWATRIDHPVVFGEDSYLQMPPLDLRALSFDPQLELALISDAPGFEGLWIETSIDGGPFVKLGEYEDEGSVNWYNTHSDYWRSISNWRVASHSIDGGAGHVVVVRIRAEFDPSINARGGVIDDLRVVLGPYSDGQVPQPGVAMMDSPGAIDTLGEGPESGHPGPYGVDVSVSTELLSLSFAGEPNQAISLYVGPVQTGMAFIPGAGQVDLGPGTFLLASGLLSGGLNSFFFTNPEGEQTVAFTMPPSLAGSVLGLQSVIQRPGPGFALSNAIEVTALP